ncbi:MAG: sensor histidine kinase [Rhizobiaceae bacterium]
MELEVGKSELNSPEHGSSVIEESSESAEKISQATPPTPVKPDGNSRIPEKSREPAKPNFVPGKKRKGILSRSFKAVRDNLFSSLTRRIVILNMVGLAILLGTILYMNQFREGLIDAKIESLLTQGRIIAGAIAGSATASPDAITIDPEKLLELKAGESLQPRLDPLDNLRYPINPEQVAPVLRALIKPTLTRARIYDPDGVLVLDSRFLYSGGQIQSFDLPPVGGEEPEIGWIEFIGNTLNRLLRQDNLPIYKDIEGPGTQYPEVQSALTGAPRPIVRLTEKGKLTVSVAVPIQRFRAVLGVLLLSTEGDDIDRIVREERIAILRIFLVAAIVLLVLSALLASTIASPLRRLSESAVRVKRGVKSRVEIPDYSHRGDEIGDLSSSIGDMTNALYQRIEAIERFAADVSHELKNPLTSLRSAVETLPLAKTEQSRERLLEVIQHDVKRLDRLITDISDASRLDADLVRDQIERVDFAKLLENVVDASLQMARTKKQVNISLRKEGKEGQKSGYFVLGHETRLGQVINNLLDNAISFAPETGGQITVILTRNSKSIGFVVEDNGPGVQAENLDRVFERFYTDRVEHGGFGQNSGLGLSISRQIIEAHGGSIRVRNREDGVTGARFIVTLPADTSRR